MEAEVFKQFYSTLVKTLPMNSAQFRAELYSHDLLPRDTRAKVQSSAMTRAEKAEFLLTNVIEPELDLDVSMKFEDLLEVMSICDQEDLAVKIKGTLVI